MFEGKYAFHRCTPVEGARQRLLAVLSFEEVPDAEGDEELNRLFYGRAR